MEAMRNFIFATLWTVFGSDSFVPPQQDVVWNHASVWESQNGVFGIRGRSKNCLGNLTLTPNSLCLSSFYSDPEFRKMGV
jgi:hypothetical protein